MLENWTCLVVTCSTMSSALTSEKEIEYLKKKGRIPESLCVLTVEDPVPNMGSGAATLNALLVATEYLSAQQNFMVVTSDVLFTARILILHNGRDYLYSLSGKAFVQLPLEYKPEDKNNICYSSGIISNLELLLSVIDKISRNSPHGVWVCSTDMTVLCPTKNLTLDLDWENAADVVLFCVPSDVAYATGHGVIEIDELGLISNIFYCGAESKIKGTARPQLGDKVPLVSGIVYMRVSVAESLLSLHVQSPLDSCTYMGLDSGAEPIQMSLFFDILVAMCSGVGMQEFISGKCGQAYSVKANVASSTSARSLIWNELSRCNMSPGLLQFCEHIYWSEQDNAQNHLNNLFQIAHSSIVHSIIKLDPQSASSKHLVVNSVVKSAQPCILRSGSAVFNSMLNLRSLSVGAGSFVSGICVDDATFDLHIPDFLVLMSVKVKNSEEGSFIIAFDAKESLQMPRKPAFIDKKIITLDLSLKSVLKFYTNQSSEASLKSDPSESKALKKYSLAEILTMIDCSKNLEFRRHVYSKVCLKIIEETLTCNQDVAILPFFYAACAEGWSSAVMDLLDKVLLGNHSSVVKIRTLSNVADHLGALAGSKGGLRSGPGSNPAWSSGFSLLMKGQEQEGLLVLKEARQKWLDRPDHIMRAARHYERAAQVLIQRSVSSVTQFIHLSSGLAPSYKTEVLVECPARIDLQGGWTDTPPICYELGGSVVNIAVLVDSKKPIGVKAFRIKEPVIKLRIGIGDFCPEILLKEVSDVLNYDQPNAKGALLKACLICADVVDINSDKSLAEQLTSKQGGGLTVQSWSKLPQGCGMGTSSILAGAVIGALWSITGKGFDKSDVVHAVLLVEQLLTTGGGWQDQVSGIVGGVNRGFSEACLPLSVKVDRLSLSTDIINLLNSHFLLIYTGKVRLAKNLLQNVVRNWYAREETVVGCFKDLIQCSLEMKRFVCQGNLEEVGKLMNKYWEQKKLIAPGCEPLVVRTMMERLKPVCFGQTLVGAGGGGFMCILTKAPNAIEDIQVLLAELVASYKMTFHSVSVDSSGLVIKFIP